MAIKTSEFKKRRRRVKKLAENAAREHFEAYLVENNPWSTLDEIAKAEAAKHGACRDHAREHRRLSRDINAAARVYRITPGRHRRRRTRRRARRY